MLVYDALVCSNCHFVFSFFHLSPSTIQLACSNEVNFPHFPQDPTDDVTHIRTVDRDAHANIFELLQHLIVEFGPFLGVVGVVVLVVEAFVVFAAIHLVVELVGC